MPAHDFVDNTNDSLENPQNPLQLSTILYKICNTLHYTATQCNALQHTTTPWEKYTHSWFCRQYRWFASKFTTILCNTLHTLQHINLPVISSTVRMVHFEIHCNALQHTATHCNTLQHSATHCNTHTCQWFRRQCRWWCALKSTATHFKNLQICNALQHTTHHTHLPVVSSTTRMVRFKIHRNALQCTAKVCDTLQHSATHIFTQESVVNADGALWNPL